MDKKNTLLLTVIAVATLLVAIVGATFAYFTAQLGTGAQADINVRTHTSDVLSYGTFNKLEIVANQDNFKNDAGSLRGTTEGHIALTINDAAEEEVSYCYTVTLNVEKNTFSHYPESAEDVNATTRKAKPELLFAIYNDVTDDGSGSKEKANYTEIKDTITDFGLNGVHQELVDSGSDNELTNLKVCDNNGANPEDDCKTLESINGYDITTVGNSEAKAVKIPNKSYTSDGLTDQYQFKISGESGKTITHFWKAEVIFLNWSWDQQYNASVTQEQADEWNKAYPDKSIQQKTVEFTAKLNFSKVDCRNAGA